jgi:tyrosyl-tRNA synthetase
MKTEQLKLFNDLYAKFNKRCGHICHNLLKDLNNYKFMYQYELSSDSSKVNCWGSNDDYCEEYYDSFPSDFIYKSDEEILQWKNEILEKQRKEKEEKEKIKRQHELDCEYQKYIELKRKFEK